MKRRSKTREEWVESLRYNIKDAREALKNAVGMSDWRGVRKYAAQLEILERKLHDAEERRAPLASKRGGREFGMRSWQERQMVRAHRAGLRDPKRRRRA